MVEEQPSGSKAVGRLASSIRQRRSRPVEAQSAGCYTEDFSLLFSGSVEEQSTGWSAIGRLRSNRSVAMQRTLREDFCQDRRRNLWRPRGQRLRGRQLRGRRPQDLHCFRGYCQGNDPLVGSPRRNYLSRRGGRAGPGRTRLGRADQAGGRMPIGVHSAVTFLVAGLGR